MTPATAQSAAFETEGDAGNTDENFRELFAVERLGRCGRLEDSMRTAGEFGSIANPSRDDRARRRVNARIEDRATGGQRVGQDAVGRDFVTGSFVEDDRGRGAVELARDHLPLDDLRPCSGALGAERIAARDHDRAKIFLFVRHSRCHGGSGLNYPIAPRLRGARLSLSFSIRLTAGLYPRYVPSRKPSLRLKSTARSSCW